MSYVWYTALNETLKSIDLAVDGWTFIAQGATSSDERCALSWDIDWIAVRRHCGGLLILRRTYCTDNIMTIEEIPISSAKSWIKLNNQLSISGYPELEVA